MSSFTSSTTPPEAAPSLHGLSFQAKLIIGVCGLVLLTGAAVTWLAHRSAHHSTEMLTDALFREASAHAVSETRAFTERATPVVESLRRLANAGLVLDDPDRLARRLLAFLQSNPGLSWVSMSNEAGGFTGVNRTADGRLHVRMTRIANGKSPTIECDVQPDGTWRPAAGIRQRLRSTQPSVVRGGQGSGRVMWLPPYIFYDQGVPGITCGAPLLDRMGKFRGVVTADFDLNALTKFVARLSVSPKSRFFMFTSNGTLLAHPTQKVVGTEGQRAAGELSTLADVDDPLVEAFRGRVSPSPLPTGVSESFHRFQFERDGTEYLASTTAFRVGDDQVWVVGAVAPKADFLADVWRSQSHRPHGRGRHPARRDRTCRLHGPFCFNAGVENDWIHEPSRRRRPGSQSSVRRRPRIPQPRRRAEPNDRRSSRPASTSTFAGHRDGGAAAAVAQGAATSSRARCGRAQHVLRRNRRGLLRLPSARRGRPRCGARRPGRRHGPRCGGGFGHGRRPIRLARPGDCGRGSRGFDESAQPPHRGRSRRRTVHDHAPVGHRRQDAIHALGRVQATTP